MKFLIDIKYIQNFISFISEEIKSSEIANYQKSIKINGNAEIIISTNFNAFVISNREFIDSITELELNRVSIEKNINKLVNGIVILINKHTNETFLYNDIFGFYPVYFLMISDKISHFSNNFISLKEISSNNVDDFAVLDMLLFNYPLFNRTLNRDVKRLIGGSFIHLQQNKQVVEFGLFNYANNFSPSKGKVLAVKPKVLGSFINNAIKTNLNQGIPTYLTMTSGFDSRTLLASINNQGLDCKSITFGQDGNIEMKVLEHFIDKFSSFHKNFYLDKSYLDELPTLFDDFIGKSSDGPVVLDLLHYLSLKKEVQGHNLIAGFMGGEILVGQSLGSEVTFTRFASKLLQSKTKDELIVFFEQHIKDIPYIDYKKVKAIQSDYLESLLDYLSADKNNNNVLRFLINEKYAKFFGTINKFYSADVNLIVPFMNYDILEYVLNSKSSFLYKKQFHKSPFLNYYTKKLHARTIVDLCPALGETMFDRLYRVNDLARNYRFPYVFWGYFESHFLKKNKKKYPRPHHYDAWYKKVVINPFNKAMESLDIFNVSYTITDELYDKLTPLEKKKIATISSIFLAQNK
ncbi:MAG: hypothetical protein RBQ97_10710 [Acholeplasma sp.]|nr:hypothetical protein [Acholeplasma sp.]